MKYSFFLEKPNSITPTFIFFNATCFDGRLKCSIGEKVMPSNWKEDNSGTIKNSNANSQIAKVRLLIDNIFKDGKQITVKELKELLKDKLNISKQKKEEFGFFQMWDAIYKDRQSGHELFKGKKFSNGSLENYRCTRNVLQGYENKGNKLSMQYFDKVQFKSLYNYLSNDCGIAKNSLPFYFSHIKTFLKAAFVKGYHSSLYFKDPNFAYSSDSSDNIYLTFAELEAIDNVILNKVQSIIRDWFLIEAYTALRVSDTLRLKSLNIVGETVTIEAIKTGEIVIIPFHKVLRNVLKRNNGSWPPLKSAWSINRGIKMIAKDMGIFNELILWKEVRQGKTITTYSPKYELITTHTGRRSFITNFLESGVPESYVMKLAGIKSHATLTKYNKISSKQVAENVAKLAVFQ